ncbi:bidirectional sugar transporter SWEET7a-like [Triticum dicoccoides]|uniref:bidirectional sugar transporter SWEET7a-like n=1 Tax=Triticum dicoccoides TaxID=85692 RepID=UPI001890ACA4|nr:bidirectional sugar transporter SWEET7a-like [Triticum dicoccoides]
MALSGMRGLSVFISDIRNCHNKEQECLHVDKDLGNIRTRFKNEKDAWFYAKDLILSWETMTTYGAIGPFVVQPTFWRIIKNKDVEEFKSNLYLATLLNCMLWVFYDILCVIFGSAMYTCPLTIMGKVIKTKSVEYMPFFLSLVSFLNSVRWTSYALIKFDLYVTIPNGLAMLFGLVLYACYYRSTPKKEKSIKLKCD